MNPRLLPAAASDDGQGWQQTVVAFLAVVFGALGGLLFLNADVLGKPRVRAMPSLRGAARLLPHKGGGRLTR